MKQSGITLILALLIVIVWLPIIGFCEPSKCSLQNFLRSNTVPIALALTISFFMVRWSDVFRPTRQKIAFFIVLTAISVAAVLMLVRPSVANPIFYLIFFLVFSPFTYPISCAALHVHCRLFGSK